MPHSPRSPDFEDLLKSAHSSVLSAGAVLGGAVFVWQAINSAMQDDEDAVAPSAAAGPPEPRQPGDAVLVFGGTGKLGRQVVKKVHISGPNTSLPSAAGPAVCAYILALNNRRGG